MNRFAFLYQDYYYILFGKSFNSSLFVFKLGHHKQDSPYIIITSDNSES